jgi:hypothetical protein
MFLYVLKLSVNNVLYFFIYSLLDLLFFYSTLRGLRFTEQEDAVLGPGTVAELPTTGLHLICLFVQAIAERRAWAKFGMSRNDKPGTGTVNDKQILYINN